MVKKLNWSEMRSLPPDKMALARRALEDVRLGKPLGAALREYSWNKSPLSKSALVAAYQQLVEAGEMEPDETLLAVIRLKPVRTLSGVTTVTVLTKAHPCPGDCIFCPTEAKMPKSYLPDEPGAARAFQNDFDPYAQVRSRLDALEAVGHPTDKIELLILGGTWSVYPAEYQEWFIRRCFDAMNEADSATLDEAQQRNETAPHRNVGLVIETRPDEINPAGLAWLRRLGVTKVQMGAQSLDDRILALNQRGHTVAETRRACALLRAAGFKIVLHWMPNLLGATPESDQDDFARLWAPLEQDGGFAPDEIKIYPTQLLETAELYEYWQRGEYHPYLTDELIGLIANIKPTIPAYCRVNRVIRDFSSKHVMAGNKRTSLRQDVLVELTHRGQACHCVRCREVHDEKVDANQLALDDLVYYPAYAEEHFLSFVTLDDRIAGYLRLSLPGQNTPLPQLNLADLAGAALVREVHVFGQSLAVGEEQSGAAQHIGLGTALLQKAGEIAGVKGYKRLAVIAAIGTRRYYEGRGFERGELYMTREL